MTLFKRPHSSAHVSVERFGEEAIFFSISNCLALLYSVVFLFNCLAMCLFIHGRDFLGRDIFKGTFLSMIVEILDLK
jgi:hypothetical protein